MASAPSGSHADTWLAGRGWLRQVALRHPSPMSLPLMVERFREQLSTEQLANRLDRILREMERDAAAGTA